MSILIGTVAGTLLLIGHPGPVRTGSRKPVMLMARPIPRADLKKQESRWACRRSGSTHLIVGLTGLLNPYLKPAQSIYTL
jgi:hypothetical protein